MQGCEKRGNPCPISPMTHPPDTHQLAAWLRLELEHGIGPVHARMLVGAIGQPADLYASDKKRLQIVGGEKLAQQLATPLSKAKHQAIDHAIRWSQQPGNQILTPCHPCYPPWLAQLNDAPIVLYVRGNLDCLNQEGLAIVGARQATADGKERAHHFARELAGHGYCIVSGLAHGIDAAAHRGALNAQRLTGSTVAVMGTGVDVVYPPSHHALAEQIVQHGGALVSAMRLGTPALPVHFPRRNRIVAGLSKGVLVIEAALRSGSLITAREAADMGRDVFATPGSIRSALSRGPHALIRQGAVLVESLEDILSEWGRTYNLSSSSSRQASLPIMAPDSPVWRAIGYDPVSEDTILQRTQLRLADMQTQLLDLLLEGWVEKDATGRFSRTHRNLTP